MEADHALLAVRSNNEEKSDRIDLSDADKLLSTTDAIAGLFKFAKSADTHILTKIVMRKDLQTMIDFFQVEHEAISERITQVGADKASESLL